MTAFDAAVAVLFCDPNVSKVAVYTSPTGELAACRVIMDMPDTVLEPFEESSVVAPDRHIDVRASEVVPATNGRFTVDGADYEITQNPFVPEDDPSRLTYRSPVRLL